MTDPLKQKLSESLVIFDGAMGTEIYRRNFFVNASYEELSLSKPDVIADIHRRYLDAGAEVLTTNSYNANSRRLARFGLADRTAQINAAAVRIARETAAGRALIAGSVGPVGEPDSTADRRSRPEILSEQIAALSSADFIMFESLRTTADTAAALAAMLNFPELPYVLSFALDSHAAAASGQDELENFLALVAAHPGTPPTALGLNCGAGPEEALVNLERLIRRTELPVIVQPNAGAPRTVDGRMLYMTSAEYFSTYAKRYAQLGAAAIGGCCGINPDHIAELARSVKPIVRAETRVIELGGGSGSPLPDPPPLAKRSRLGAKLAAGEFVVTVEITPPRGFDLTKTLAGARQCAAAGIDAVNLPDGPRASSRISTLVTAMAIERECGIETLAHCCCRDRSLIGLQAELLGYAGAGLHNLLFITGDPPKLGDYPFSSGVFDIDSIGLVKLQNGMNRGVDLGGQPLNAPTSAVIGVGVDPNAIDLDREFERARRKIEAGADFIVTQPVFDPEKLLGFIHRLREFRVPVIAGIWPLVSLKNAEFMRTEVPGVTVPDSVMRRMAASPDRDVQRETGLAIARENLAALRGEIAGAALSAPFGNVTTALRVLEPLEK